jgi:hypothetical protein
MKTEAVIFETVTPHPGPVKVAELLGEIEGVITRHVVLSDQAAAALAVWVLHSYTFELRDTVAYVAIESPEKRCGKTTLLSVLAAMACKSLIASNITVGALFRAIHTCTPTLFIDEADTFLAGNSIMRGIINSGNTRRTAYVLRLAAGRGKHKTVEGYKLKVEGNYISGGTTLPHPSPLPLGEGVSAAQQHRPTSRGGERLAGTLAPPNLPVEGSEMGLRKYSCWCPKVIAMIGEVPDTIADRSIVVKMARKLTSEVCVPLAALDTMEIKAKCARFALDAREAIAQHPKIAGEGLNDRAADTFDPLFVIARLAGEEWEKKLRAAALALCSTADTENSGSGLILDVLDIFSENGQDKMFSRDIVASLREGGIGTPKYSSVNEHQIARILRPYGVKPMAMRIGREVRNGYMGADFREALKRYVSKEDIEARVRGIERRWQLQDEAKAEEAKSRALFQKFLATVPNYESIPERELKELAIKFAKEQVVG